MRKSALLFLLLLVGFAPLAAAENLFVQASGPIAEASAIGDLPSFEAKSFEDEAVAVRAEVLTGEHGFVVTLGGTEYVAEKGKVEFRAADEFVWRGSIGLSRFRSTITSVDGFTAGVVYLPSGEIYELSPSWNTHVLRKVDLSSLPACDGPAPIPASIAKKIAMRKSVAKAAAAGTIYEITAMEIYEFAAVEAVGGELQLRAAIQNAVDVANTNLVDSGVAARLRLVYSGLVSYTGSGNSADDLGWVANDSGVAALRAQYRADLVGIWVEHDASGRSWAFRPTEFFEADLGFHAILRGTALTAYIYSHEIGHNLGFDHDQANAMPPSDDPRPYARGYIRTTNPKFRDIMSYPGASCPFGSCEIAPLFSTPLKSWRGVPAGVAGLADNVRVANEIGAAAVSAYLTSPPVPCAVNDTTLCLNNDRFRVEVVWQTLDGNTGAGHAIPRTADSGEFWFFGATNIELVVKVLGPAYGHFWVFYGALSDVHYVITVTDTATGAVKVYDNPQGRMASVGDTSAFPVP